MGVGQGWGTVVGFMQEGRGLWEGLGLDTVLVSAPVSCCLPVYQQPQQQQAAQSYGGYKEPAAPVSIQRSAPGGGGVSSPGRGQGEGSWGRWLGLGKGFLDLENPEAQPASPDL